MQGTLYTSCSFNQFGHCFVRLELDLKPEEPWEAFELAEHLDSTARALLAIRTPKVLRESTYGCETSLQFILHSKGLDLQHHLVYEYEGKAKQPEELQKLIELGLAVEAPLTFIPEENTN